jgi:UDP-glucose 4-epimerase
VGLDNLSAGSLSNLSHSLVSSHFKFVKADMIESEAIAQALGDCDFIYHLAADPEVRTGASNPRVHFLQNVHATFVLLEALRERKRKCIANEYARRCEPKSAT